MVRRAPEYNVGTLRNKTARRTPCISWLLQHPILDQEDIAFVKEEEARLYKELTKQREEQEASAAAANQPVALSHWTTKDPFLRFICALCHDRAQEAFKYKDDTLTRPELDARNNDDRPKTWEEVVCDLYNDDSIIFTTEVFPLLHFEFGYAIDLYFHDMPGGTITPEDVKKRFATMRAELILVSLRELYC
jgi:hypothetical protein